MELFGWFRKRGREGTDGARAWREAWTKAVASLDPGAVAPLEAALRASPPLAEDL